jgi:Ca2+-binding EF-hand superfamily protein
LKNPENGKLSLEEALDVFPKYFATLSENQIKDIFYAADLDKDGFLSKEEWVAAMSIRKGKISEEKLDAAFDFFDKDHCGVLHLTDLK